MIKMVRKLLKERINPKKPPTVFTIKKTNSKFIHQAMMIIHPYYYKNKGDHSNYWNELEIANYSHEIMGEYCKYRRDFHLPADGEFDKDALFVNLEKSKNMDFFDLLDCMMQVLYDETRKRGRGYIEYNSLVNELNDSMRINGIGYQIIEGRLSVQTEQKVFKDITAPCLIALNENDMYEADLFINNAFDAYKEGLFEEAIMNACKALENVIFELCQREMIEIKEDEKIPSMLRKLMNEEDVPKQIQEHCDAIVKIMETVATIRNKRAAHGREIREINSALVRYTIDMTCVDILFLVRTFCEEKR